MLTILVSVYFSSLVLFSFTSYPVSYCVLMLLNALSVSGVVYCVVGFSWYLVLFSLVYVGGVYVLFIFVSVHVANASSFVGNSVFFFFFFFFFFFVLFSQVCVFSSSCVIESSYYLCAFFEGFSYCLFCLVLMVGFISLSMIMGEKDSFFR